MLAAMMAVAAFWSPLAPATDQAVLTRLFSRPVVTRLTLETPVQLGTVRNWRGSGCQSRFDVRISARKTLHPDIDWRYPERNANQIALHGSRVILEGGFSVATDINWLEFRFRTIAEAREVALAFRRLRAACRPQR